jgi:signal transduction histidine kinase
LAHVKVYIGALPAALDKIQTTALRVAKIVRGLLTFSRKNDNFPLIISDLSKIVSETLDLCQERIRKRNITIKVNLIGNPKVQCNPEQISQILLNLLGNSCDAIEQTPHPWIEVELFTIGSEFARIQVTDSGSGIPPEVHERIMQPFYTTKQVGKGTGLGLSISKGLAESHGGKLAYDPECKNTRFYLDLPLTQAGLTSKTKTAS